MDRLMLFLFNLGRTGQRAHGKRRRATPSQK